MQIGTATALTIKSASATVITFGTYTATKMSDNVADLGTNALLFRNGGTERSFTAKIAGFTNGSARKLGSRAIGIGSQPIAGRLSKRTSTVNAADTQTVTSSIDGTLSFTRAVANTPQTITIDTSVPVDSGSGTGSGGSSRDRLRSLCPSGVSLKVPS
ncbi:MAG: hypothetical protein ACOYM2_13610 [Rectinemataceae bacterium]